MDPLLAAAVDSLGIRDRPRPLTAYHPNAWRTDAWRVKTATGPHEAARLVHECDAVALLHEQGLHPATAAHGSVDGGVWAAVGWLDGHTLWDLCAPAREGHRPEGFDARLLDVAHAAFTTLDRLHTAGWVHGDVQAENVLITDNGDVALIDSDFTHHPDLLPLPYPYRGGLDIGTAPEIARRLTSTDSHRHVTLDPAAETYSLGAALRYAWTGAIPGLEHDLRIGETTAPALGNIAAGRHRRCLADERPYPHPAFEALLQAAMNEDPTHRTTPGTSQPRL